MSPMVNDMGIDPKEWFDNPLDSMPVAKDTGGFDWEDTAPSEYEPPTDNKYAPPEKRAELEQNPRPEEEIADWFDESDQIEHEKTMHQKMYEIATSKYNPFAIGGSEQLGGGSEKAHK